MAGFFESAQDAYKMQTQAIESLANSQEVAADGIMANAAEEEDDGVLGSLKSFVNDIKASREKRRQESAEEPVMPQTKSKPTISQELVDKFMNETKLRYPDMVDKAPNKPLDFSDEAVEKQEAPKPEYQPNEKIGNARTEERMGLMSQDTVDEETTTTSDSSTSSDTPSLMEPPAKKVTGLEIVNGSRADYAPTADMPNISLDFNSFKGAKGTEVIIPDDATPEVRAAAEKFNQLVVEFAAKHGYENYKNRGVKTRSENKRGVSNTIHLEPFFTQDAKIEAIINDNMDEFAQIYKTAFEGVTGRMVLPHGVENSKGIQDRGAVSKTFGDEYSFGEMIISRLLGE